MEQKIKEVQEYFKQKMLKGEFQIAKITDHWIRAVIDNQYDFFIWVANGESHVRLYESEMNFICFDFTEEERNILWTLLDTIFTEYKATESLRAKREAYNKLALELGKEPILE